jgi:hypothetical protein
MNPRLNPFLFRYDKLGGSQFFLNVFFAILSSLYISGIFLWADSPMVQEWSAFNPYSLLHIPLYGILTLLLTFSILPFNPKNVALHLLPIDPSHLHVNKILNNLRVLLIPGMIALGVAIADEIHQSFLPKRNASIIDVFLDLFGISLTLWFLFRIYRKELITQYLKNPVASGGVKTSSPFK